MKKKNFLFAGIAILACSVFVSSCSKDEDYAGVDYYEDWTPEQFETFASKSVSIRGENGTGNTGVGTSETKIGEKEIRENKTFYFPKGSCSATYYAHCVVEVYERYDSLADNTTYFASISKEDDSNSLMNMNVVSCTINHSNSTANVQVEFYVPDPYDDSFYGEVSLFQNYSIYVRV